MILYFRSDVFRSNGIRKPVCDLSLSKKTMIAFNEDITQCGIMVDVTNEQKQSIIDTGGELTTKQALSDIYSFPASFPPPLVMQ